MRWLWTWGGVSFGYRLDYALFTHDGQLVGRFYDEEVYGIDGLYLGELKQPDRLITDPAKKQCCRRAFRPAHSACFERPARRTALAMEAGCAEFPQPEALRLRSLCSVPEARQRGIEPPQPLHLRPPFGLARELVTGLARTTVRMAERGRAQVKGSARGALAAARGCLIRPARADQHRRRLLSVSKTLGAGVPSSAPATP